MPEGQNSNNSGDVNNGSGADPLAPDFTVAEKTLTGDLRDSLLQLFRDERNPWHLMSEERQTLLAARVESYCQGLVSRAVHIIAARDFPVIGVALEQVNFKPKGVEAKMTFGAMGAKIRHALVDAQGGGIVIVVADEAIYRGSRGLARVDRQAPELPLDGEGSDIPGDPASGTEPTEPGDAYARQTGREDGRLGVRDHAARYPAGAAGHGDYEIGHAEGRREREAYQAGAEAARADGVEAENPYEAETPEGAAWEAGWTFGRGTLSASEDEPPPRRGRPRKPPESRPEA